MNKSNTTEKEIHSHNWSAFINWYVRVVIIGIVVTLIAAAIFED